MRLNGLSIYCNRREQHKNASSHKGGRLNFTLRRFIRYNFVLYAGLYHIGISSVTAKSKVRQILYPRS